ncbi:MAG: hypothetical protein B6A08_10025 [Sorangiineae bacterium NIC37A_2]|nr:MAG: hypothetical protein B6A08_10025 [Sorangiineae bacterium NIC37A_2]
MDPEELLKSLSGLLGVTSVGGKLTIESNSALPTCEAEGLRDAIGAANIQGEITISGNGGGGDCALTRSGRGMPVLSGERRSVRPVVGSDGISKRARYAAGRRWT